LSGPLAPPADASRTHPLRWVVAGLLGLVMVGSAVALRSESEAVGAWVTAARDAGPLGMLAFVFVYAVSTVVGVPATFLTLAAGFAWGPWKGALLVWPGAVMGAMGAFTLTRTLLRDVVAARVARDPRFAAIDAAVHDEGGRLALLLRLSPATPFNLTNFGLGVTSIGWVPYLWSTAVGILPGTLLYVYFGSTVDSLSALASGRPGDAHGVGVMFWVGLVATLAATVLLTRAARRALDAHLTAGGTPP
jgi:uncharacterized membrane protein YdjX (TVP38/TMEM64 family)